MAPRCAPPAEALQVADNLGRFGWRFVGPARLPENQADLSPPTSPHLSGPKSLTHKQIAPPRKDLHCGHNPGLPNWYSGCPYLQPKTTEPPKPHQ